MEFNEERLDSDILANMTKYTAITALLSKEGIELISVDSGNPQLEDAKCGFKMTHNIITWQTFPVEEVAKMIISDRDKYIIRAEEDKKDKYLATYLSKEFRKSADCFGKSYNRDGQAMFEDTFIKIVKEIIKGQSNGK